MKSRDASKRLVLLIVSLSLVLSCSDFTKSSPASGAPPQPSGEVGTNQGLDPFPDGYDPNAQSFSQEHMLANIGLNVIAPQTKRLRLYLELLQEEADSKDPKSLEAMQSSWQRAMLAYHFLAALKIGPLNSEKLKIDPMYSWPNLNPCGIDLEVAKLSNGDPASPTLLFTSKGLAALEYLLFEKDLVTACNSKNRKHAAAFLWQEKPTEEKRRSRLLLIKRLTKDLVTQAQWLEAQWDRDSANFSKSWSSGTAFSGSRNSIKALSDALFSIEDIKNLRLGPPLGAAPSCGASDLRCPELVEHQWSGLALKAIQVQFEAWRAVFSGSLRANNMITFGLKDYLSNLGHEKLGQDLIVDLEQLIERAKTLDENGPLQTQVANLNREACITDQKDPRADQSENPSLCRLYTELRKTIGVLKSDFLLAVSLDMPPIYQGDND